MRIRPLATPGRPTVVGAMLVLVLGLPSSVSAQRSEPLPQELEGVGIQEHLDAKIPLDLAFTDEMGRSVRLGDYFNRDRPILLSLVYYRCPMLCTLVLNGAIDALKEVPLTPGKDFDLLTISFDPLETPALAKLKKQSYIPQYGRPESAGSWHFLTGKQEEITALTSSVGFGYRWSDETKQFVHQAAIFVLTPDGRISRYLYGVMFDPTTLKLSILEAGKGKIGSPLDQIILYCFHYDAASGKYSLAATNIMRAGGILTVVILGAALGFFWIRDARSKKAGLSRQES